MLNRHDRGQILIMTAFSLVALLAIAALSLDVSYMYDKRNRLYAAADAAAKSGAIEVHRNSSITLANLQQFANQQVIYHGFDPYGTTTVTVSNCGTSGHAPCNGPYTGNDNYVEVFVSEPTATFLATVLGRFSMTPGARAVAGTSPGVNCIVTLGGPGSVPTSLNIGSSSTINLPGCAIADNGDLSIDSSAYIVDASTGVTGTCSGTGGGCSHVSNMNTGSTPASDPLANLPTLTNTYGACTSPPIAGGGTLTTLSGNACYSSIDATTNQPNIFLNPGVYYITGPFRVGNNATVTGSGVLLYFAGTAATGGCTATATAGCIDVANSATFNLSAPTSGTYNGILMFQEATDQLNATFDGNNPIYNLSGAMYFPNADVSFRNGLNATNDCMLFVARSLLIEHGNGSFSNVCSAYGGSPILTVSIAE
jgi:Flp pilus assembly protein TadG